jgi:hypothetical protein
MEADIGNLYIDQYAVYFFGVIIKGKGSIFLQVVDQTGKGIAGEISADVLFILAMCCL